MGARATSAIASARCAPSASRRVGRVSAWCFGEISLPLESDAHQLVDDDSVLGVHAHQGAVLARLAQRPEDGRVVGQHHPRIGHEHLVARHPFVREPAHLLDPGCGEVGDDHVEGVVDGGPAGCLGVPGVEGIEGGRAFRLDREVHDARRPAVCGGAGAGLEVVRGHGAAERHLDMGVGIDPARDDESSRRIDDGIGVDHQVAADQGDGLVTDEEVGTVVVDRGDDSSILDQHAHCLDSAPNRQVTPPALPAPGPQFHIP